METLIDLIVWIFKAIFGDEKSADMKTRTPQSRSTTRRGPYNYGDDGGARRPKTLEEILEEVRREALLKKGGYVPPTPPSQPLQRMPPASAPSVRSDTRTLRAPLQSERTLSESLGKIAPEGGREALGRLERAPTLPTLPEMTRSAPQPGKPAYKPPMAEQISPEEAAAALAITAQNPQAISTVREMNAYLTQPAPDVSTPALEFVKALRRATPQARREAAWQAVVLGEIFGPPRSRQHGRRLI